MGNTLVKALAITVLFGGGWAVLYLIVKTIL
jgi:hypothetical protein